MLRRCAVRVARRPGCSAHMACCATTWGGYLQCRRVRSHGKPAQYQSASGSARRGRGCGVSGSACGRLRVPYFWGAFMVSGWGRHGPSHATFFWCLGYDRGYRLSMYHCTHYEQLATYHQRGLSTPFPSVMYVLPSARCDEMGNALHSRRIVLNTINSLARKSYDPFREPRLCPPGQDVRRI